MPTLREEIEQAFPGALVAEDLRSLAPTLKTLPAETFASHLPAFMLASLDDPMDGDPIPAMIISEIPKRAAQMRALTPAQRRILAKYVAAMAGDHELMKGHLLKALNELKPGG
jgi:hypothetical protein